LQGTATTASFVTASNVVGTVTSASFAQTASLASFALAANTAGTASEANSIATAITDNVDNYILTATGTGTINGEGSLTFDGNKLTAQSSFVQGGGKANGLYSHAEGESSEANGNYSHAEGSATFAGYSQGYRADSITAGTCSLSSDYGDLSAEYTAGDQVLFDDTAYGAAYGTQTLSVISSSYSGSITQVYFTAGLTTTTASIGNITYGIGNWAGGYPIGGQYSHAEGLDTYALGQYSHAEGRGTQAIGYASHAEGTNTQAIGVASHAEGIYTTTIGRRSHAEGSVTQTLGEASHAEGSGSIASGSYSHAEGGSTQAIGDYSHAEGNSTQAIGSGSHAEGKSTQAIGDFSHAEGYSTIASGSHQHVSGQYNTHGDTTSLFIVGNGVDNATRKDAFKVTPSGSIVIPTTVSSTPGWTGVQGEMVFGDNGAVYKLFVWLNGGWRSTPLT
jgi:hypothetical protein